MIELKRCLDCDKVKELEEFRQRAVKYNLSTGETVASTYPVSYCKACELASNTGKRSIQSRYNALELEAARSNLPFSLKYSQFEKIYSQPCNYCGSKKKGRLTKSNLNMLNPNKGYTLANLISCCPTCNSLPYNHKELQMLSPGLKAITNKRKED